MPVTVTLTYDDLPEELSALEQAHNAGQPAQTVGYLEEGAPSAEAWTHPTEDQLTHMEKHPEDYQFHNAGKPAVTTGGGNQLCVPQEWNEDLSTH